MYIHVYIIPVVLPVHAVVFLIVCDVSKFVYVICLKIYSMN